MTRRLSDDAINGRYVHETGRAIVERFRGDKSTPTIDPMAVPACLVNGHAPFVWGRTPRQAVHHAVVLEAVSRMAHRTLAVAPNAAGVSQALLDLHYFRKHGRDATYGQDKG